MSGRARPVSSGTPRRVRGALILVVIACAVAGGILLQRHLTSAGDNPKETGQPQISLEPKSTTAELTPEDEIAALKKEEMDLAERVMREFPRSEGSYMLMGDLHARHGNSAEAARFWEKSLEVNPRQFDACRNMGRIALEKEQFDEAVRYLRKALEIDPNVADVRSDIAKALMDSGKYAEAVAELEQEIESFPPSFTARFQLAEAYRQQEEYDKAVEQYERIISRQPEHSHSYYGLAMAYTRMGQRDKAQECMAAFRKLRDKVDSTYDDRQIGSTEYLMSLRSSVVKTYLDAESLYRAGGNIEQTEALLRRACELEPDNTRLLERLASLYYATKRAGKALECFEEIAKLDPGNSFAHLNVAKVASQLRMFEKAEQAFRKSIAVAPGNAAGYRDLANFYLRTGKNRAQAQQLAQKAVDLEANAESYFLLGWAADVNGDRALALRAMEQATKLEPANQRYRQIYETIKRKN